MEIPHEYESRMPGMRLRGATRNHPRDPRSAPAAAALSTAFHDR